MGNPPSKPKQTYGIAEWYGRPFTALSGAERKTLADTKNTTQICPYMAQVPTLGPKNGKLTCNKASGVCSLRNFHGVSIDGTAIEFGPITTTCPNRFLEAGTIIEHIGAVLLQTDRPLFAKELPFLRRPRSPAAAEAVDETQQDEDLAAVNEAVVDAGREDVGRIDLVFVHPENREKWCAVEMQAVYFSGGAMSEDLAKIRTFEGNSIPTPGVPRRPDFRSSGPKRLMPQLLIKVPTLRRWGKKMVVVIDRPFFEAMDTMEVVDDISNCDIVWVVVRYDQDDLLGHNRLVIDRTIFTTLEDSVKGLTAGDPTTLTEFEQKLSKRVLQALPDRPTLPIP